MHNHNQLRKQIAASLNQFSVDGSYNAIWPHNYWNAALRIVNDLEKQGFVIRRKSAGKTLIELAESGKL